MNFKIDNLQYCNWSRETFEFNRSAGLDAVHVTIVYHEDYNELLTEIKKWEKHLKRMGGKSKYFKDEKEFMDNLKKHSKKHK